MMLDQILNLILFIAMLVVLWQIICVAGQVNIETFDGHAARFLGLAFHYALAAGGAVAVVAGEVHPGAIMLLISLALRAVSDRRRFL